MKLWFLIFSLFLSLNSFSEEGDGAHNPDLLAARNLAEDVRDVVTHTSDPNMHPNPNGNFRLTTDQSDRMHAVAGLDEEILSLNVYVPDCEESEDGVQVDPMSERVKMS